MLIAVLEYLLIFGFLMVKSEDLESWYGRSEHEGICQHWASLWGGLVGFLWEVVVVCTFRASLGLVNSPEIHFLISTWKGLTARR